MNYKWRCTNCEEDFIEEIPEDFNGSEDFEIEEFVMDIAREHVVECMNGDDFIKLIGLEKANNEVPQR